VDEVEKASVKGPDDEKIETEKETPLEIVVVKESDKDKLVVGKVEESVVKEEVPMAEVEKASVKGPEPLEVVTVEESYKDKVVVAMQLTPGTLIGGWIEGRVEESVVEEEVSEEKPEKAFMRGPDEGKAETEKETHLEVVMVEASEKDKMVEGKVEESVVEEEVPVDEVENASVKGPDEGKAETEDETPFEPKLNSTQIEVVMMEESDKDEVIAGKVEESVVEEEGGEDTSAQRKLYIKNKNQQDKVVVAEGAVVDKVFDRKEDWAEIIEPENIEKAGLVSGVFMAEEVTQKEAVVARVTANEKVAGPGAGAASSKDNDKRSSFKERNTFRDDMAEKAEDVESGKPAVQEATVEEDESVDEVTVEGAEGRRELKRAEVNTEEVDVMEKVVVKLDKALVQGAVESNTKQELDYEDGKLEVQESEDDGDGYWWDADEDLKKLEEEDEVDVSFGIVAKEDVEKKLRQLAIKNGSLEQQSETETEESEAAKEQSCWRSS